MQSIIPYINSNDPTLVDNQEIESAIAYLLSLNNKETLVDELVKAYYPFMAFETDEGYAFFDLLLLSETEKTQTSVFDVSGAITKLSESRPDTRVDMIEKCKSILTSHGSETLKIKGLINNENINQFLAEAGKTEATKPDFFKPQLTQKQFKSLKNRLKEREKDREALIKDIKQAIENLQAFIQKVENENSKNYELLMKESRKNLDQLEKTNTKAIKEVEKSLEKSLKEMTKSFDSKANDVREELEYIENTQKEITGGNFGARKSRLENELKARQLMWQLESLEKEKNKELSELEAGAEKTKEAIKVQFDEFEENENQNMDRVIENDNETLGKINDLSAILGDLEDSVSQEYMYLAKLQDLKYKDGAHVFVPLYIHKSDNMYGVHTPIKLLDAGATKKTLSFLRAEDLNEKVSRHVKSETESLDMLMEMLVQQLSTETKLKKEYDKKLAEENLLTSRSLLDQIEVGLYKLYEWEWINEKDYMIAQRCLIEKMDTLNGGNQYQREQDPIPEIPPQQEIPA